MFLAIARNDNINYLNYPRCECDVLCDFFILHKASKSLIHLVLAFFIL
jgi:hypothetical protein